MRSPCVITQPTRGFGSVLARPRSASPRARCMASRSSSESALTAATSLRRGARSFLLPRAPGGIVGRGLRRQQRQLISGAGARHGALLQRLLHAGAQLPLIEGLAATIALDHHRHHELRRLESREALAALQALAAAADLTAFPREARVGHLGLDVAAEGTVHAACTAPVATVRTPESVRTARAPSGAPARSPPGRPPRPAPRR